MKSSLIKMRHYANSEGRTALATGYTGPNPYADQPGQAATQWAEGYTAAMRGRLRRGLSAIPEKIEIKSAKAKRADMNLHND